MAHDTYSEDRAQVSFSPAGTSGKPKWAQPRQEHQIQIYTPPTNMA